MIMNLQEKVVWRNLNIFQKVPISAQAINACDANRTQPPVIATKMLFFGGKKHE
jgi:hypothetical protein